VLRRGATWVRRYAHVDGPRQRFSYKADAKDTTEKHAIDLASAKVTKGARKGGWPFVAIETDAKDLDEDVQHDGTTDAISVGNTYYCKKQKEPKVIWKWDYTLKVWYRWSHYSKSWMYWGPSKGDFTAAGWTWYSGYWHHGGYVFKYHKHK
jgi:hypothetical protein